MTTQPSYGPIMILMGNIIIAVGIIILAFSMSTITVYPPTSFNPATPNYSFSIGAILLTLGTLFIGIGGLIRSFGVFIATKR